MITASVTGINTTLLTLQDSINSNLPVIDAANVTVTLQHTGTVFTNLKYPYGIVGLYGIINAIIFVILVRLYPRTPAHPSRLITFSKSIIECATQSAYGQRCTEQEHEEERRNKNGSKKSNRSKVDSISNPVSDINNALDRIEREEKHLDDLPFDIVTATHARTGSIAFNKSFRQRHDSTISLRSNHNYSSHNKVFSRQSSTVSDPVIAGETHETANSRVVPSATPSSAGDLLKKVVTLQALNSLSKSETQMTALETVDTSKKEATAARVTTGAGEAVTGKGDTKSTMMVRVNKLVKSKCKDPWKVTIVALSIAFMHIYYGLEITFGSFLTTYTAKSDLQLDTKVGAQLTSMFWATFTFWRLITIFYIGFTGSELAIFISLAIMLLGNCILVPFGNQYVWALWLGTATIGIGISSIWASMFGFLEDYFPVTSQIASSMITAAMVGEFFFPVIIAKYVDCSPMVFAWVCLGCSLSLPVLFVSIVILCRYKLKKASVPTLPDTSANAS